MIGRLSTIITKSKAWIFEHPAARYGWYLLVVLGLLLFWLYTNEAEISFIYNAF